MTEQEKKELLEAVRKVVREVISAALLDHRSQARKIIDREQVS